MATLSSIPESWRVNKPAVRSPGGVVVTQHVQASRVGAAVLSDGGNAVDAAVAAAFAVGTVEPWMSGIGGCGYMVAYAAKEHKSYAVEFGVKSSRDLDPSDYPLVAGVGPDLFTWPSVAGDRNIRGPLSVAVPGMVAGLDLALRTFGTLTWRDALAPATRLAEQGMQVDWYGTLKIASAARDLAEDAHCSRVFLPGGFVPVAEWAGPLPEIRLGELARTLRRLGDAGAQDFYRGEIAGDILADAEALGIRLSGSDLATYEPHLSEVERGSYRDSEIDVVPGLTAGPTLEHALGSLEQSLKPASAAPDAAAYASYARSLYDAYDHRLAFVGDVPQGPPPSCTTHINVADREGNLVALTVTLLSLFGSKVMLPRTGILMNNGVMWFDPRPGRPNSMAPGKRPLSNMCPVVLLRGDGQRFALGASGGRRIMPAVFQLISFLTDYGMSVEDAIHHPRLDVSGAEVVTIDAAMPPAVADAISAGHRIQRLPNGVYPNLFACPSVAGHDPETGLSTGGAFVVSPRAEAVPARVASRPGRGAS